jgi:hypothetical protein
MKKLLTAMILLTISFAATAQNTAGKNKTAPGNKPKAGFDYLLDIKGVPGESTDSIPPKPGNTTVKYGPIIKIKPKGG